VLCCFESVSAFLELLFNSIRITMGRSRSTPHKSHKLKSRIKVVKMR